MTDYMGVLYYESPIGLIEIKGTENAVTEIRFTDEKMEVAESNFPVLQKSREQLDAYFSGRLKEFNVPLKFEGTDFQKQVWQELMQIPFGETATYGEIAKKIKRAKAVRAVGGANHNNPISIIIPCHRVIGSNGKLVGYGGGLWRKQWLLEHEKKHKA